MTFGELLKEFLEGKNLRVEDYEDKFNMSYYTMHKYLSNKVLPGYHFLYQLKKQGFNLSSAFTKEVFDETLEEWRDQKGTKRYANEKKK